MNFITVFNHQCFKIIDSLNLHYRKDQIAPPRTCLHCLNFKYIIVMFFNRYYVLIIV